MDKYLVKFIFSNGKIEYHRYENTLQKPFDSKELAGKYSLGEAQNIFNEYVGNHYRNWEKIELEEYING